MFAKCATLVIAVGACGCTLLAMRQQRLQVASELAHTQLRIAAADERLWGLRSAISEAVSPRNVDEMARSVGPLRAITSDPPLPEPPPVQVVTAPATPPTNAKPPDPESKPAAKKPRGTRARNPASASPPRIAQRDTR